MTPNTWEHVQYNVKCLIKGQIGSDYIEDIEFIPTNSSSH